MADPKLPQEVFAQRLRAVRERHGYSQEQLADRTPGLSATAVLRIERGRRDVKLDDIIALALALDVAPIHLLVPLDSTEPLALSPEQAAAAGEVRAWFRGERPLQGVDERTYSSETPAALWDQGEHGREFGQLHSRIEELQQQRLEILNAHLDRIRPEVERAVAAAATEEEAGRIRAEALQVGKEDVGELEEELTRLQKRQSELAKARYKFERGF